MLKSIEGNFDNPEVNKLLTKHFIELRQASPEGSAHVLDIEGLKHQSIKFWSLWIDDELFGLDATIRSEYVNFNESQSAFEEKQSKIFQNSMSQKVLLIRYLKMFLFHYIFFIDTKLKLQQKL